MLANTNRITGGVEARPGAWPFQVGLFQPVSDTEVSLYCGGTLIGDRWVLTAAHCPADKGHEVWVGTSDLRTIPTRWGRVVNVHRRADYVPATHDADIAVLELDREIDGARVKLASLQGVVDPRDPLKIIGWGARLEGSRPTARLREAEILPFAHDQCSDLYAARRLQVTDTMLCAGADGKDTCQGDSGGPLLWHTGGTWVQVGITSWGLGCGRHGVPGVYTNLETYLPWINETCHGCLGIQGG